MAARKLLDRQVLTRQIRNAKRRLKRLRFEQTHWNHEYAAPWDLGVIEQVACLDKEIKEEEQLIASLEKKRAELKK